MPDTADRPAYGVALNSHELAHHQTVLELIDALNVRLNTLETDMWHLKRHNRIYGTIATSTTVMSALAIALALSALFNK